MKFNYIRQQGAVLLMSLVLLVVLTLLGISALDSTKLETRMAANVKEDHTAFQAANAGIDQAYHHYVLKGKSNEFENLEDFPDNEWSATEPVISKSGTAGLKFDNSAAASVRLKKVVIPETSQWFFIIESTGRTNCADDGSGCKGHKVQLTEGWSFEGAKKSIEQSDEMKKCLKYSKPNCQVFFDEINTCLNTPGCIQPTDVHADCSEADDEAFLLPPYCSTIFNNIINGLPPINS